MSGVNIIDVTGDSKHALDLTLAIAFEAIGDRDRNAAGWKVIDKVLPGERKIKELHFCESLDNGFTPFVTPIDQHDAVTIVSSWLKWTTYPSEPGTDGSTKRGWRVQSMHDMWSHSFVRIQPAWTVYGK